MRYLHPTNLRSNLAIASLPLADQSDPDLSLVVPAYNEEESIPGLYARILDSLPDDIRWELILVDDGSSDRTPQRIVELACRDPRVRGLRLSQNSGQTAATRAGIQTARGSLIATLDADLQNDPADLPAMMAALGDADAIVGYRVVRRDNWLRRVSSKIGNGVRNRISGDHVRDTGCALKVFRSEAIMKIPLFEGMHRFLPTLLRFHGYRVIEYPVSHHPRIAGSSKYGVWNRAWVAFKDLLAIRWMSSRIIRSTSHPLLVE